MHYTIIIYYSMFSVCLLCAYLMVIAIYIYHWNQIEQEAIPPSYVPSTDLTVLVAARNEADAIEACLTALVQQDYPDALHQIYIIDDHSEDDTAAIVQRYVKRYAHVHLLSLPQGQTGKKSALAYGIEHSTGQLIVTTDADCTMERAWLSHMAHYYETKQPKFIAAPVRFHQEESLFELFQSLDFMGMMVITAAGIRGQFMSLCNGANLAYERSVFEEVGGFEGIDHIASGDDMLLLQKIQARYPDKIGFLKQKKAIAYTKAKPTVGAFLEQRLRWTSKSSAYKGWQVWLMLGIVWLLCISMVLDLMIGLWNWMFLFWLLLKLVVKGMGDYFFLRMSASFFGRASLMRVFIPASIMHWWYIAVVGTLGLFRRRYHWKGRHVS